MPEPVVTENAGVGTRTHGKVEAMDPELAAQLIDWRDEEHDWVKALILRFAYERGEFHADMLADREFSNRNVIGVAVRALVGRGLIESTGEHRRSTAAASKGRRSYVYRLTRERGWPLIVLAIKTAEERERAEAA